MSLLNELRQQVDRMALSLLRVLYLEKALIDGEIADIENRIRKEKP